MSNTEFLAKNGLIVGGNAHIRVAVGNTAQRPASPLPGDLRYNTDTDSYEAYTIASGWGSIGSSFSLPANVVIVSNLTVGNSTVYGFLNSTSFTLGSNFINANGSAAFGNSTANVQFTPISMQIGNNTVVNTTYVGVGNSTVNVLINSTAVAVGANNVSNSTAQAVGNATVQTIQDKTQFRVTDASGNAYVNSSGLQINGGNVAVTANGLQVSTTMTVNGTTTFVGNSTVNAVMNSSTVSVGANSTVNSSAYSVGNSTVNAVVNSTGLYLNGAPLSTGFSTGDVRFSGNSTLTGFIDVTQGAQTLLTNAYANLYAVAGDTWLPNTKITTPASLYTFRDTTYWSANQVTPASRFLNGNFILMRATKGDGGTIQSNANSGILAYSTDGMFFKNTFPFSSGGASANQTFVIDIAYGNGLYVAIGGKANTSADGVTTPAFTNCQIAFSPDLVNWTMAGSPAINASMSFASIEYGNGNFVVCGNNNSGGGNGYLLTSANANTWSVSYESSAIANVFMTVYGGQGYWFLGCRSADIGPANGGVWASGLNTLTSWTQISNGVANATGTNTSGFIGAMGVGNTSLGEVVWLSIPTSGVVSPLASLVRATNNSVSSLTTWSNNLFSANVPAGANTPIAINYPIFSRGASAPFNGVRTSAPAGQPGFGNYPNRIVYAQNTYSFLCSTTGGSIRYFTAMIDSVNTTAGWNIFAFNGDGLSANGHSDLLFNPTTGRAMAVTLQSKSGTGGMAIGLADSPGKPNSTVWYYSPATHAGPYNLSIGGASFFLSQPNALVQPLNGNLVAFVPTSIALCANTTNTAPPMYLSVLQSGDGGNTFTAMSTFAIANSLSANSLTSIQDSAYGNGVYLVLATFQVQNGSYVGSSGMQQQLTVYNSPNLTSWAQTSITTSPAGLLPAPVVSYAFSPWSTSTANVTDTTDSMSRNRIAYGNGQFYIGVGYWGNSSLINPWSFANNLGWMSGNGTSLTKSTAPSTNTPMSPAFPLYSNGTVVFQNMANSFSVIYTTDGTTAQFGSLPAVGVGLPLNGADTVNTWKLEAAGGGTYLFSYGNTSGSPQTNQVMASTRDLTHWTVSPLPWGTSDWNPDRGGIPMGIAYVQNTFVRFSSQGLSAWISKDGIDWTGGYYSTTSNATYANSVNLGQGGGVSYYLNPRPVVWNNNSIWIDAGFTTPPVANNLVSVTPLANSTQFNLPRIPAPGPGIRSWVKT